MTAIASLSDLVSKGSGANKQTLMWHKTGRVGGAQITSTANQWNSAWLYEGAPGAGSAPGAVAIPDNTTPGSFLITDPGGGREKFLTSFQYGSYLSHTVRLYDRLLHISGLSATVTTPQTVGGVITRNTGGVGNQIWVEIYTQIGAVSQTITASYTNQAGASGKTTTAVLFGATSYREIYRTFPLPLAAGDTGVQSVQSVTVTNSTGTAGDFGITLIKPLLTIPTLQHQSIGRAGLIQGRGPTKLTSGACYAMMFIPISGIFLARGTMQMVES